MSELQSKIYLVSQLIGFQNKQDLQQVVSDWVTLTKIITTPEELYYNDTETAFACTEDRIADFIQALVLKPEEPLQLTLKNEEAEFFIQIYGGVFLEKSAITNKDFVHYQFMIEDYLTQRMKKYGVYSYIRSYDEYIYSNQSDLNERGNETKAEQELLPKIYDQQKEILVDCNQLPGYDIFYKGLCFTSCWKMWFGPLYYQLIPKRIFLEVQQVEEIVVHEEDIIVITLSKRPENWKNPNIQYYQQLFRDQIGMDQFTWDNGIGVLREPFIEYIYIENEINTVQYQNEHFQPVPKSQAKHFITRIENLADGKAVERRKFGMLNSNAYFPWQDEAKKSMMNYRILNPACSVDGGTKAYEFYIRQFLEVNLKDENYQNYLPILRLYIPKESVDTLPLDELQCSLKDTQITNVRTKKASKSFDVKKANNRLRVIFSEYADLEKEAQIIQKTETPKQKQPS